LSGTWGDTVNNYISTYIDSAVAGSLTLTADTTLTKTTNASLGATSSQYAIIIASPTSAAITITAPAASKIYVVNNTSATYSVTFKASGQSGVSLAVSEKALLAFNGTDFVKIASSAFSGTLLTSSGGTGLTSFTAGDIVYYASGTAFNKLGIGSSNTVMTSSGSAPQWSTSLSLASTLSAAGITSTSTVTGTSLVPSGSTVATNGMYLSATNNVNIATNSTNRIDFTAAGYTRPVAYADTVVASGNTGTALTLTLTSGNVFTATLTGNATITLSTPVATGSSSLTLILTNDSTAGRTVAWAGGTFKFPGGAAALTRTTTASGVDVWVFFTPDGGTTWYGNIAMKNMTT
jgi:hypothetical protein